MKVLYADHDPKIRNYVSMLLESGLDFEVLECSSGNEALAVCEMEEGIDFIITEVQMPNGNGDKILEYFDNKKMKLPFIWLSAPENEKVMFVQESLSRGGANAFVPKPFKDADFFPHVEKIIQFVEEGETVEFEDGELDDNLLEKDTQKNSANSDELHKDEWERAKDPEAADWSLKKEHKHQGTVAADWSLKKEQDDGWGNLKKKGSSGTTDSSKQKNKESDEIVFSEKTKEILKKRFESKTSEEEYDFSKYKKVKLKRFYQFNSVPCEVYVKLSKTKYIKIIPENELYDHELLERYEGKKIKYLFVPVEQHPYLIDLVGQEIFSQAEKIFNSNSSVEMKSVAELGIFNHVNESVKLLGISDANAKKVTRAVEYNLKTLAQNPSIYDLISKMIKGDHFVSEHSLLLSYICGQICLSTSWSSNQTLEKLSMAAMMHDIGFDNIELAEAHDMQKNEFEFEDDQLEIIHDHPGVAAKLITSGKSVFPDVDTIIMQHHESPDGQGYPRKLGPLSISPLSCIMIIAEDFVTKIYGKSKEQIDIKKIKEEFSEKYNRGNFKKPLQGFLTAF